MPKGDAVLVAFPGADVFVVPNGDAVVFPKAGFPKGDAPVGFAVVVVPKGDAPGGFAVVDVLAVPKGDGFDAVPNGDAPAPPKAGLPKALLPVVVFAVVLFALPNALLPLVVEENAGAPNALPLLFWPNALLLGV